MRIIVRSWMNGRHEEEGGVLMFEQPQMYPRGWIQELRRIMGQNTKPSTLVLSPASKDI